MPHLSFKVLPPQEAHPDLSNPGGLALPLTLSLCHTLNTLLCRLITLPVVTLASNIFLPS